MHPALLAGVVRRLACKPLLPASAVTMVRKSFDSRAVRKGMRCGGVLAASRCTVQHPVTHTTYNKIMITHVQGHCTTIAGQRSVGCMCWTWMVQRWPQRGERYSHHQQANWSGYQLHLPIAVHQTHTPPEHTRQQHQHHNSRCGFQVRQTRMGLSATHPSSIPWLWWAGESVA